MPDHFENGRPDRCRLVRTDGTVWRVADVSVVDCCFQVTAYRVDGGNEGRDQQESLHDEPLERGDRLEWLNSADEVVWSARCPVGQLT